MSDSTEGIVTTPCRIPTPRDRIRPSAGRSPSGSPAGFLSGLFGVGGGILIVPAMVIGLGVAQKLAHGTSLAAVLPIGLSGVIGYALDDKVDWPVLALLAVGAVVGAVVGTHILHRFPQRAVGYAFAALLVATAVRLLVDHSEATGRAPLSLLGAAALVVSGASPACSPACSASAAAS